MGQIQANQSPSMTREGAIQALGLNGDLTLKNLLAAYSLKFEESMRMDGDAGTIKRLELAKAIYVLSLEGNGLIKADVPQVPHMIQTFGQSGYTSDTNAKHTGNFSLNELRRVSFNLNSAGSMEEACQNIVPILGDVKYALSLESVEGSHQTFGSVVALDISNRFGKNTADYENRVSTLGDFKRAISVLKGAGVEKVFDVFDRAINNGFSQSIRTVFCKTVCGFMGVGKSPLGLEGRANETIDFLETINSLDLNLKVFLGVGDSQNNTKMTPAIEGLYNLSMELKEQEDQKISIEFDKRLKAIGIDTGNDAMWVVDSVFKKVKSS